MKVLVIAHNATIEGAGIAYVNIIRELIKREVEVVAVLRGYKGVYNLLDNLDGVHRYVIPEIQNEVYPETGSFNSIIKFLPKLFRSAIYHYIFKRKLTDIVVKERPDIIHSNTGTLRIGSIVAKKFGIPHVWHVRECQVVGCDFRPLGGERKVESLFSEPNNHCIAITKSVFEYYHLNQDKDVVIYDGVFNESQIPICRPFAKEKTILYVGLLSEKKGVTMLIDAFSKIARYIPDYRLLLAGVDGLGIDGIIERLPCKKQVEYLGFRKDIYDLMAKAKAVVVPSVYEGFGFITAEAMLNRTMVIGRDTAGTKEQMDNAREQSGEDVAMRFITAEELAEKITEITKLSEETYLYLTEKAFRAVIELYTTERNGNEIVRFYNSILNINTSKNE